MRDNNLKVEIRWQKKNNYIIGVLELIETMAI